MSFETASKAIDRMFSLHEADHSSFHILFTGGEPFMEFELIKNILGYCKSKYKDKTIFYKAVSNGTLIHDEIQNWLWSNKDLFQIELSLDGTIENHNLSRTNSFQKIDFPFFYKFADPLNISTVISPESLDKMAENIIFLEQKGAHVKAVFADGMDWPKLQTSKILSTQLAELIEYYLKNPNIRVFNMLSLATSALESLSLPQKCSPGIHSNAVDIHGDIFPCHRCSPYYNNGGWKISEEDLKLKNISILDEACHDCYVKNICNACPASIASLKNKPEQKQIRCQLSKILFYANASFHLRLLKECPRHNFLKNRSKENKLAMLKASKFILEHLNPEMAF